MINLVIDASVVLKWYLIDEEFGDKALDILYRYVEGNIDLFAPTILFYEVLNALLIAERRDRISKKVTETAVNGFLDLEIKFYNPFNTGQDIINFAHTFNRSVYDASYLALANEHNINFVTGDKCMYNSVKGKLKWVKWIGE